MEDNPPVGWPAKRGRADGLLGPRAIGIGLLSETAGSANACRLKIARYVDAVVLSR
jgi:hypothetical protein